MTLGMLFDTEGRLILERVDILPTRQAEILLEASRRGCISAFGSCLCLELGLFHYTHIYLYLYYICKFYMDGFATQACGTRLPQATSFYSAPSGICLRYHQALLIFIFPVGPSGFSLKEIEHIFVKRLICSSSKTSLFWEDFKVQIWDSALLFKVSRGKETQHLSIL